MIAAGSTSPARPTVLVVDEDLAVIEQIQIDLADVDVAVQIATNAQDATESIAKLSPQVILLDPTIDAMQGFDICRSGLLPKS